VDSLATSGAQIRRGLLFGVVSGLAAITCCTSPVVLVHLRRRGRCTVRGAVSIWRLLLTLAAAAAVTYAALFWVTRFLGIRFG